jgi:hypothetical protein
MHLHLNKFWRQIKLLSKKKSFKLKNFLRIVHLKVLFIIEIDRRLTRGQPFDRQSKLKVKGFQNGQSQSQ